MTMHLIAGLQSAGFLSLAMGLLALVEIAIPLRQRDRWSRAHLGPNLALTLLAFATNALLDAALVVALGALAPTGLGLLPVLRLPPAAAAAITVIVLDIAFYLAHVAMHEHPLLWRFHRVHHSDPALDVTTTLRQHPVDGTFRFAVLAVFAIALGATPAAYAIARACSALSGLLEHANVRIPSWLDELLSLAFTWPGLHKVHHSRDVRLTNTNYGNLFSLWDRLFATFTPASHGLDLDYGLDGFDAPGTQTTRALLLARPSGNPGGSKWTGPVYDAPPRGVTPS